jgi:sugar/nucleoside kinase (ribokinase family)
MKKQLDVLAIGELNVDLILNNISGFPVVGKEIHAGDMVLTLGSSTAIFASNLSSLGLKVGFLGKTGDDSFGDLVKKSLISKNIDTSLVITEKSLSTGATIVLNYSEDRAMVTYPGAMDYLTIDDISDESLTKARHIHFSSLFFQPGIKNDIHILFKRAKDLGLSTSLDTQWDPTEKWDFDFRKILPFVDVFMPNEAEFLNIARVTDTNDALKLIGPFANNIVIKRSNRGSLLYNRHDGIIELPAYLNMDVVDAIGAGDSFNAGFIFRFVNGKPLKECLDFGNLTGALNTTAAGGTAAFASRKDIIKNIRKKFNISIEL